MSDKCFCHFQGYQVKDPIARPMAEENKARIDNLVPNNGEQTEGNTELIDIRVGGDGVTYETAGGAVRGQYNKALEFARNEANKNYICMDGFYYPVKFEGDTSGYNPLYFYMLNDVGMLYMRGSANNNVSWVDLKEQLSANVATSPKGVNSIIIPHNSSLVFNISTSIYEIVETQNMAYNQIPIFVVSGGRSVGGVGQHLYERFCVNADIDSTRYFALVEANKNYVCMDGFYYPIKFEGDRSGYNPLYFYMLDDTGMIYIRGAANHSDSWAALKSQLSANVTTSPKGVNSIIIPHNSSLVYNISTSTYEIVETQNITYNQLPIFVVSGGRSVGGVGQHLYERFCVNADIDNAIQTAVKMVNPTPETYFNNEITATVNSLRTACTSKSFVFAVVTDTHYTGANNWKNTIKNIKAVNEKYKLDAVFHLGDMVNGNLTKGETIGLIEEVRNSLIDLGIPVFTINGNHDNNTSYQNTAEGISQEELYSILGRYNDINVVREGNKNYFYYDLDSFNIRVICLDSYIDDTTTSWASTWGYSAELVEWVENVALDTDKQVIFFSHQAFTKEFNAFNLLYGEAENLRGVVENFKVNGGTVIGLFHGHTHWDNIAKKNTIYEISTGCSNTNADQPDYIPTGATIPARTTGTVTEDLWDVVVVQPTERKVKMIRFGAGNDRQFTY